MTSRSLIASVLALATASLGFATPAHAKSLGHRDATRDVQRYDIDDLSHRTDPTHANGDLKRFRVQYRPHEIRIVETFRELDHSDPVLAFGGTFKLPSGKTTDIVVMARESNNWKGKARLDGHPGCAVRRHIGYAANRATIVVPAGCLKTPRWVRFEAAAVTTDNFNNPSYFFVDVSPSKNVNKSTYTKRIHRG